MASPTERTIEELSHTNDGIEAIERLMILDTVLNGDARDELRMIRSILVEHRSKLDV